MHFGDEASAVELSTVVCRYSGVDKFKIFPFVRLRDAVAQFERLVETNGELARDHDRGTRMGPESIHVRRIGDGYITCMDGYVFDARGASVLYFPSEFRSFHASPGGLGEVNAKAREDFYTVMANSEDISVRCPQLLRYDSENFCDSSERDDCAVRLFV